MKYTACKSRTLAAEFDPFLLPAAARVHAARIKKGHNFWCARLPPKKKRTFPFHTQNDIPAENILFHIYSPVLSRSSITGVCVHILEETLGLLVFQVILQRRCWCYFWLPAHIESVRNKWRCLNLCINLHTHTSAHVSPHSKSLASTWDNITRIIWRLYFVPGGRGKNSERYNLK